MHVQKQPMRSSTRPPRATRSPNAAATTSGSRAFGRSAHRESLAVLGPRRPGLRSGLLVRHSAPESPSCDLTVLAVSDACWLVARHKARCCGTGDQPGEPKRLTAGSETSPWWRRKLYMLVEAMDCCPGMKGAQAIGDERATTCTSLSTTETPQVSANHLLSAYLFLRQCVPG